MGRPAKPTHLKIVQGNPGKRALPKNEPKPQGDLSPNPPSWLPSEAKKEWKAVMKCAPAGLLKLVDESSLLVYVTAKATHRQAAEQLAKENLTITSLNGGLIQNPLVGVMNRQAEIMLKAASQMGFSPASRAKVSIDPGDDKPQGGFGEFA